MIGLSAQDEDIQSLFVDADTRSSWSWDDDRPPHAFAEEQLGPPQMNILKVLYEEDYDEHGPEILSRSKVRAYAKSLLVGLVLDVLRRKLQGYLLLIETRIPPRELEELSTGLTVLRDIAASACPQGGEHGFIERLVLTSKHLGATFDLGEPGAPLAQYRPLGAFPVHQIPTDPTLASGGLRELAVALALIGLGHDNRAWRLVWSENVTSSGALVLTSETFGETRMFVCAHLESGAQLFESGVLDAQSGDAVVIYARGNPERRRRHPSAQRGRTGREEAREVGMLDLLASTTSATELAELFAQEVVA